MDCELAVIYISNFNGNNVYHKNNVIAFYSWREEGNEFTG